MTSSCASSRVTRLARTIAMPTPPSAAFSERYAASRTARSRAAVASVRKLAS
jgi:hypothetical protein